MLLFTKLNQYTIAGFGVQESNIGAMSTGSGSFINELDSLI
jgi:hypothetical protein